MEIIVVIRSGTDPMMPVCLGVGGKQASPEDNPSGVTCHLEDGGIMKVRFRRKMTPSVSRLPFLGKLPPLFYPHLGCWPIKAKARVKL